MRDPASPPALTTSARRATAAAAVRAAAPELDPLAAVIAVDLADGAVGGILAALGLSRAESQAVLSVWWEPER